MISGAIFSTDRRHRYILWRIWDEETKPLMVIGLNPSTADEIKNDPTVTRCIKRAYNLGFGGLYMANLYGYRSTDPKGLKHTDDPVGLYNDSTILSYASESGMIIAAWGTHGSSRGPMLANYLKNNGIQLHALRILKHNIPAHPLYLPYDLKPIEYWR